MSDFDLVPVDGGDPVHLPPGETVVGRGPFLGVSDKRVSRQHGLLENLNGQLRLKPIHLNPCFVQSSLSDEPRPLQKDSWHLLHHGDLFSLLPGRFIYEVVAVGGEEHTPRNSQMFDEEELQLSPAAGPDQKQNQSPPQDVLTPAAPSNIEDTNSPSSSPKQEDSARLVEDVQRDDAPSVTRRRVLPAWMMAAVAAPRPSSSQKAPSAVKGGKSPAVSVSSKRAAAARATPTVSSSPVEAELSEEEEERPRKRTRKMSNREEKRQTEKDVLSEEPSRSELSGESDNFPAASGKGNTSTRTSEISESETDKKPKSKLTAKEAESVESNGSSASVQPPSKCPVRTACPYGKDCYRKNPLHFQECSHPGDTDYEEEEEDEDDEDRPECPYGTDCYRKNPLHRKEYKHTRRPARATRRVAKNTPDEDEEDEDEEYDDSFIDDDSEDVGDDSDYVPPESDDEGKEDVKRLQREAATFLKRRK
ncbi:aprataxin and PNK-like factor [Acanthochromis polyacanthus]|uniref:Aprataxin and PNKP like factor n=1 Tax=Acanthochromis polyacanthus TaxID=80966 RepID=A0A3Q1GVA7_9TELE|nr:aprataxin and PNK-like factor [Acanthochromis polyacanthus]